MLCPLSNPEGPSLVTQRGSGGQCIVMEIREFTGPLARNVDDRLRLRVS
jgi:hypothetical protein